MNDINSRNDHDNFDDYFNHAEDLTDIEYYDDEDEIMSDAEYGQYLKSIVNEKIENSKIQILKDKFNDFKYNGGMDSNFQNKSIDDRKKMFFIMAGVGVVFVVIAIVFVMKKV